MKFDEEMEQAAKTIQNKYRKKQQNKQNQKKEDNVAENKKKKLGSF